MALTLLEASKKFDGQELRQGIIELFARSHPLLGVMQFQNINGNALKYNQEGTLPGVAFRGVNEGYTESTGVINPVVESLTIAGGDCDVDKFILKTMGEDQRAAQTAMKIKSLAHTVAHKIIKGDSMVDPKEFDGLQTRITGTQKLANGASSGGDVLSLSKLDELIDLVDGGTHLLMSKAVKRSLTQAARSTTVGGFITQSKDEFGRPIDMYNGLPIVIMDPNDAVNATLAFNEANPGGGSSVGTSIYCVAIGDGKFNGIQNGDIDAMDLGELQTKPVKRTRVEWYPGICVFHGRSIARLWGIKAGAVAA